MADAGEVARALTLLLDGAPAEFTAACLQQFLKGHKERYKVQSEIDRLDGVVCLYEASVDGIISDIKEDTGGTYTGSRERIFNMLSNWEMGDHVWDSLSDDRREMIEDLRKAGFIKEFEHKSDCPGAEDGLFYKCTCKK